MEKIKLKEIKLICFGSSMSESFREKRGYEWDSLLDSIKINGFLPEKYGYITISKDKYCLDGYHRYVVLKELYGENYEINVIRKKRSYILEVLPKLFLYLLLTPIRLIKKFFKKPLL